MSAPARAIPPRGPAKTADMLEASLAELLRQGFTAFQADKVFEAIDLPAPTVIAHRIAGLRALGFADPVKMITSLPAILGYAHENIEAKLALLAKLGFADPVKMITSLPAILGYAHDRVALVCRIVGRLEDAGAEKLSQLVMKRRALLDEIDAAEMTSWADVRAHLKRGAA